MPYRNRRSPRHPSHDYTSESVYFVTICTQSRMPFFEDDASVAAVQEVWSALPDHYPDVLVDAFVVMPNHVHGLLSLEARDAGSNDSRAGLSPAPSRGKDPKERIKGLPEVIASFKSFAARRVNELHGQRGRQLWQRSSRDTIVHNEHAIPAIRQYIWENPFKLHTHFDVSGGGSFDDEVFWHRVLAPES